MFAPVPDALCVFLEQVRERCASIDSMWLIGAHAGDAVRRSTGLVDWDLLAFADSRALYLLRRSVYLHRQDVQLRVVTDGQRFENAWGERRDAASIFGWNWRRASDTHAYFDEAVWSEPTENGLVRRIRRRALRVWEAPAHAAELRRAVSRHGRVAPLR
jgi:hypothetical protein